MLEERKAEKIGRILIPWTGGFDSTALILKALSEGFSVYAPYIFLHESQGCYSEVCARNRIKNYLVSIGIWNGESHISQEIYDNTINVRGEQYYYPKWMVQACLDLPEDIKEIWIGYTGSDRTAKNFNLDHHCNIIPSINSMINLTYMRYVEVKIPFYDTNKVDMLKYYSPPDIRKVFSLLSNCTAGLSYESGCKCDKCTKLKSLEDILNKSI
jgi:7-cyano-7-deazaguanine synthase in queuosine biosynthesis